MPFTTKPKYELNQVINVKIMGMLTPIRITKRKFFGDYDKQSILFTYDFVHDIKTIIKPWDWSDVTEESLDEMAYEGSIQVRESINAYFDKKERAARGKC